LVEAVARRCKNGEQRCKRHCALSRLESARAKISLRGTQDHCVSHETTDTDPGLATSKEDYSLETYILSTNHYQIELLANLDQVPETGALVVVSFPKPKGGSGFPARVFAIVP
jgi:kynurenine formamidase